MFSKGNDFVKLRRYGPQKRLPSCQAHQHGIGPFIFPEQVCERHRIKELYVSFCPGNQFRQVLLFGSSTDQLKFNIHSACLRNLCCLYRYFEILAAADRARIQNTETVAVILRLLKFFKLVWIYSVSNHLGPSDAATCLCQQNFGRWLRQGRRGAARARSSMLRNERWRAWEGGISSTCCCHQ